jgi:CRP-like cAMP-binding protein
MFAHGLFVLFNLCKVENKIHRVVQPYLLQSSLFFDDLPENEMELLKKSGREETGKRGKLLFRQGTFPKGVIWLLSGKIKIYQETPSGQRQTLYIYTGGDLIGYRQLIADVANPVSASLLEDTTFLHIHADIFRGLIRDSPLFARNVLSMLAREFTVWMNRMTVFTQYPVRHRLVLALLILQELYRATDGSKTVITITRTELAEYVGASLETVVRALNKFKSQGLVQIRGREIRLIDLASLINMVEKED